MNIFNTAYVSNDNINLRHNTDKIVFKEGIIRINTDKLSYNQIRNLVFPKSLEEIGDYVFRSNKIETLDLPKNLKSIGEGAFRENRISKLVLPSGLDNLAPLAFKNNEIKELILNDIIKSIGYSAFQGNQIKELDLKNVERLEPCVFNDNKIELLSFSDKLEYIGPSAFQTNKIKELDLKSVKRICMEAFAYNEIKNVIIPDTVSVLEPGAFKENQIVEVKIGKNIDTIPSRCFYNNKIKTLEIPSYIKTLQMNCFAENEIENLILNDGLEEIGPRAFYANNLVSVNIPCTVIEIGVDAFNPLDVYYNGIKIEKELVKKFGTNYIIKIANIKKIHNNFNFNNLNTIALDLMPLDNDSVKGINSNIKTFENLYKALRENLNGRVNYNAVFKLAYILGFFRGDRKALESLIYLTSIFNIEELTQITETIEITKFDKKFADIMNDGLKDYNDSMKLAYIIPHFYNNIDTIKKGILKQKENQIAKLNALIKTQYREEYVPILERLKKNKNKITLDELEKFITNSLFDFSDENKELKEYSHLFNGNIKKEDTPKLENIMNLAKKVDNSKFKELEGKINGYTYKWLDNKDPLNLVLGYLVNCCSKLKGVGEDIMIQSMTNPNLRNLVIFKNNEVVAKTTAYYNNDYILCNNIEVSDKFMHTMEMNDRKDLLEAVIEGLSIQAKYLDVNEVRVGMLRNDLNRPIYELDIEIKHENLLDNYKYKNYAGDANNPVFGQALIYKK